MAREIHLPGQDSIFAPTPLLEALRTVLSMAAPDLAGLPKHDQRGLSEMRTQISVVDISRAYFNAAKDMDKDPAHVELPHEDPDRARGMYVLMRVERSCARAAEDGWHSECTSTRCLLARSSQCSGCWLTRPRHRL